MRGACPYCFELVGITPTGEPKKQGWSAQWWRVDMHRSPSEPKICPGSGVKV